MSELFFSSDYLLSQAAEQIDVPNTIIGTDYDGTLAPIINDPLKAYPAAMAIESLQALAEQGAEIPIITGREVQTLLNLTDGRLEDIPRITIIGLYGLEGYNKDKGIFTIPTIYDKAMEHARWELVRLYEELLPTFPGIALENKNRSYVMQYRNTSNPKAAQLAILGAMGEIADLYNLDVESGKMVAEMRIPNFDKGKVLDGLAEQKSSKRGLIFAGDDIGDIPAFNTVHERRDAHKNQPAFSVASADATETPPAITDAADLIVPGPDGVVSFFQRIASIKRKP